MITEVITNRRKTGMAQSVQNVIYGQNSMIGQARPFFETAFGNPIDREDMRSIGFEEMCVYNVESVPGFTRMFVTFVDGLSHLIEVCSPTEISDGMVWGFLGYLAEQHLWVVDHSIPAWYCNVRNFLVYRYRNSNGAWQLTLCTPQVFRKLLAEDYFKSQQLKATKDFDSSSLTTDAIWTPNPGFFERRLQRHSEFPFFFPDSPTITSEAVREAQERDRAEMEELKLQAKSLLAELAKAGQLPSFDQWTPFANKIGTLRLRLSGVGGEALETASTLLKIEADVIELYAATIEAGDQREGFRAKVREANELKEFLCLIMPIERECELFGVKDRISVLLSEVILSQDERPFRVALKRWDNDFQISQTMRELLAMALEKDSSRRESYLHVMQLLDELRREATLSASPTVSAPPPMPIKVMWTPKPGFFERCLQRQYEFPFFFPSRPAITRESIREAQEKDRVEKAELESSLAVFMLGLSASTKGKPRSFDDNKAIIEQIDDHLFKFAQAGGDTLKKNASLRTVRDAFWTDILNSCQSVGVEFREGIENYKALADGQCLIAQLVREIQLFSQDEEIPIVLTETILSRNEQPIKTSLRTWDIDADNSKLKRAQALDLLVTALRKDPARSEDYQYLMDLLRKPRDDKYYEALKNRSAAKEHS